MTGVLRLSPPDDVAILMPLDELGATIFRTLLEVASGQPTKSESLGVGDFEFVSWQFGAWL